MTTSDSPFLSDTPISSIGKDEFGRAGFAKNLAKSIAGVPAENGFVFALNAPWGSGKTSTLNMVQEALRKNTKINDGKKFIIVNFNPWWFSSGDSLVRDFFGQFNGALLNQKKEIGKDDIKTLMDHVYTFSSILAPVASALSLDPSIAAGLITIKSVTSGTKRLFSSPKNIHQIRQEIDRLLKKIGNSGWRVLVVMDDLDRIQPNEMREMFRLVKGVADFPNTIYLLSFDHDAVVDAIADNPNNRERARKYLEKIIQMPMDLPPVNSVLLHDLFYKEVKCILEPIQPDQWEENYWRALFREVSDFIQTPRDMKRLLNSVGATYPMVQGEVNPMDFIAIQGIRTFTPSVYDAVAKNRQLFVEIPNENIEDVLWDDDMKKKALKEQVTMFCKDVFALSPKERGKIAERVLSGIFPFWNDQIPLLEGPVPPVLKGFPNFIPASAGIVPGGSPRQGKLARHPDIFNRYFALSLSLGDIPASDMRQMIDSARHPEKFAYILMTLAKEQVPGADFSRLQIFLKYLWECRHHKDVFLFVDGILCAFLLVGDKPEVAGKSTFFTNYRMQDIAYQLLQGIPNEEYRFSICRDAFQKSKAVMEMWEWMFMFDSDIQHHSEGRIPHALINEEHCKMLKEIAVKKLQELAKKGDVWNWRNPLWLLYRLDQEVSNEARRNLVSKAISTPEGFVNFCAQIGVPEQIKELKKLADMDHQELMNRADDILRSEPTLDKTQQETLRQLMRWLKKLMPRDK